jgi:hypothetical protein
MVEMAFKRVPAGYVFGAPNPWLIGARQYYLLNEQQKSEVAVRLRRMWGYLFVAIVVAVSVIVPVTLSGIDQRPVTAFAIDVLIGLAIGLALNAYLYRSIRPLLAGFAPTTERITQGEAFQTQITVFSRGYIAFFGLLSLAMFALSAARPLFGFAGWDFWSIVGALLFGAGTIYWAALYLAKIRRSAVP